MEAIARTFDALFAIFALVRANRQSAAGFTDGSNYQFSRDGREFPTGC